MTNKKGDSLYILLVDDDSEFLLALSDHLTTLGHHTILAQDGMRAIQELWESGPFDVIITDMQMPNMSGVDLLQAMWAESNTTPVLLHNSESTGYMRIGGESRKVDISEVVSQFHGATFHMKDGSIGYINAFLDGLQP